MRSTTPGPVCWRFKSTLGVSDCARVISPSGPRQTLPCCTADAERPASARQTTLWMTYCEAAAYCRFSVGHLRNLVSAGQIPVYGKPRTRRFRRDMLDLYLTDPDAALRKFRSERNTHGG